MWQTIAKYKCKSVIAKREYNSYVVKNADGWEEKALVRKPRRKRRFSFSLHEEKLTVRRVIWVIWCHKASFFLSLVRTKFNQHIASWWKCILWYGIATKCSKNWTIKIFTISNFHKIAVQARRACSLKIECREGKFDFAFWKRNDPWTVYVSGVGAPGIIFRTVECVWGFCEVYIVVHTFRFVPGASGFWDKGNLV